MPPIKTFFRAATIAFAATIPTSMPVPTATRVNAITQPAPRPFSAVAHKNLKQIIQRSVAIEETPQPAPLSMTIELPPDTSSPTPIAAPIPVPQITVTARADDRKNQYNDTPVQLNFDLLTPSNNGEPANYYRFEPPKDQLGHLTPVDQDIRSLISLSWHPARDTQLSLHFGTSQVNKNLTTNPRPQAILATEHYTIELNQSNLGSVKGLTGTIAISPTTNTAGVTIATGLSKQTTIDQWQLTANVLMMQHVGIGNESSTFLHSGIKAQYRIDNKQSVDAGVYIDSLHSDTLKTQSHFINAGYTRQSTPSTNLRIEGSCEDNSSHAPHTPRTQCQIRAGFNFHF